MSVATRFRTIRAFARDESGGVTIWMLFWLTGLLALSGIAIDSSQAWRMKTILQSAADASAHAGLLSLSEDAIIPDIESIGEPGKLLRGDDPVDVALAIAERNISPEVLGEVLARQDVELGVWDPEDRTFEAWAEDPNAVRVRMYRARRNRNEEPTFLLKVIGFDSWDIAVESVAYAFPSPRAECPDPILAAQTRVDIQTNNIYVGICVLADVLVTADTSPDWLPQAAVDFIDELMLAKLMEAGQLDLAELGLVGDLVGDLGTTVGGIGGLLGGSGGLGVVLGPGPGSGPVSLLDEWLGTTNTQVDFDSMIADMAASADTVLDRDGLRYTDLEAGGSYYVTCQEDEFLNIPADTVLNGITLISECPVRVDQDVELKATVIISNLRALGHIELTLTEPGNIALTSPEGCYPGDGVKILIFVDTATTARFRLFDPEIYPLGDVLVAANSHGTSATGPIDLGLNLDVIGDLTLGAVVEDLLGVCLGAQFMLQVDAYAYAK